MRSPSAIVAGDLRVRGTERGADQLDHLGLAALQRRPSVVGANEGGEDARLREGPDHRGVQREQEQGRVLLADLPCVHAGLEEIERAQTERLERAAEALEGGGAEPPGLPDEHRELGPLLRERVHGVDHALGALLERGRPLERRRDLLRDALTGGRETRLQQVVLRGEVVQERLLANPDRLRDRLERGARVPLAPELADGLLDDRGSTPLATRAWHGYSQAFGRPRRATGRDPSQVRRQVGATGPASDGVSSFPARETASNQVVRSSSNSSATPRCIRSDRLWWDSPSVAWIGSPYRIVTTGRPGPGHQRPFGIAWYAPTIAIGIMSTSSSSARRAAPCRNRCMCPSGVRVPSGNTTIDHPS